MITKERLRELIAQNATIYLQNFRGKIIPYTLNENINNALNYYNVDNKCLYLMKITNNEEDDCERAWLLEKLFETKEEAEFALKPKQILDKEEKEYLEAVIKPFIRKVEYIRKLSFREIENIVILLKNDVISLPRFKKDVMYKGMVPNEEYTLEELGLFEE